MRRLTLTLLTSYPPILLILTFKWAQIEKDVVDGNLPKDSIQQRKIKCVWGPPLGSDGTSQQVHPSHLIIILLNTN